MVVNDIDAKGGERVAKEIHGDFVQADVTKGADWARLVRAAGPALDIVVNNAGWTHRNKPYLEVSEAEFDKVYAVNVKSVYLSALHAVPVFRKRGGGCFVNIASTAGIRPRPGPHRLQQLEGRGDPDVEIDGRRVRPRQDPGELREPGVQPDTGAVGGIRRRRGTDEAKKKFLATIPLGRFSTPLDVANACLYLASDEAAFVSGVCIEVDGARCV